METVTITLERYNEMTEIIKGQEREINELNLIVKKELVAVNLRDIHMNSVWQIPRERIVGVEKGILDSALLEELESLKKLVKEKNEIILDLTDTISKKEEPKKKWYQKK